MDYSSYDASRYLPEVDEASDHGMRTLAALSSFFDITNKSQNVLEVGCASGSFLKVLQSLGFSSLKGIDIDKELVLYGQKVLGVNIEANDWFTYLSNTSENYDLIIALDVFEHLTPDEAQQVLKMSYQRLSPNGKLIMRMPNPACPFVLPTFCGDLTHRLLATDDLIRHLLRVAGFSGVIKFKETYPYAKYKKFIYLILHKMFIKPMVTLFHYHFYGAKPGPITRNMYCCAERDLLHQ